MAKTYRKINRKKSVRTIMDECDDIWREIVLQSANRQCELKFCNSKDQVEAHHIYERTNPALRHDLENGIALCYNCHRNFAHRHKQDFIRAISGMRDLLYLRYKAFSKEPVDYYKRLEELKKCLEKLS